VEVYKGKGLAELILWICQGGMDILGKAEPERVRDGRERKDVGEPG